MRERAHIIGGRVDFTGIRGHGTMVTLRVPHCSDQSVKSGGVRAVPGAHHLPSSGMRREQNHDENPCSGYHAVVRDGVKRMFDEQPGKLLSSTHQIIWPAESRLGNVEFF